MSYTVYVILSMFCLQKYLVTLIKFIIRIDIFFVFYICFLLNYNLKMFKVEVNDHSYFVTIMLCMQVV